MKKNCLGILAICIGFISCKDAKFPEVKNISEYPKTVFVTTLEQDVDAKKNAVYCVSFLYCWNAVREKTGNPILIDGSLKDLTLINNSKAYIKALNKDEYKASAQVGKDGRITAYAEFSKSLPFEIPLKSYENDLSFMGKKVPAFGITGYDSYDLMTSVAIAYYQDEQNCLIKLNPKDKEHEILLMKSPKRFSNLAERQQEAMRMLQLGTKEMTDERTQDKYQLYDNDEVKIPKMAFNIETGFDALSGNTFTANKRDYTIEAAWQRTAFVLNEKGAEIESEAEIVVTTDAVPEQPKPKKILFDKPFCILLKRKDASNPYFVMYVANTELFAK